MRIRNVEFDEDENPIAFTFAMSADEAAVLYRLTGHLSPSRMAKASGDQRWADAMMEAARGLGNAFNGFYEEGVDAVIPRFNMYDQPSTST